jgi:hypothetical protein
VVTKGQKHGLSNALFPFHTARCDSEMKNSHAGLSDYFVGLPQ